MEETTGGGESCGLTWRTSGAGTGHQSLCVVFLFLRCVFLGIEFEIFFGCLVVAGNFICLLLTRNHVSEKPELMPSVVVGSRG